MSDPRNIPTEIWHLIADELNKNGPADTTVAKLGLANRFFQQSQGIAFKTLCNQLARHNLVEIDCFKPMRVIDPIYFKAINGKCYDFHGNVIKQPEKSSSYHEPQKLPPGEEAVYHGRNNSFWITKSGKVFGYGLNQDGSLGVGNDNSCFNKLTEIPSLEKFNIKHIYTFGNTTFFLASNGELLACGDNSSGQLGVGNAETCFTPTLVIGLNGLQIDDVVSSLTGFCEKTIFITPNAVFASGKNDKGQLSLGHTRDCHAPVRIDSLTGRRIRHAFSFETTPESYFLDDEGKVYSCWENRKKVYEQPKSVETLKNYAIKQISYYLDPLFLTNTGLVLYYENHAKKLQKIYINNTAELISLFREKQLTLSTLAKGARHTEHCSHYHFKKLFYHVMRDQAVLKEADKRFTSAEISFVKMVSICDGFLKGSITDNSIKLDVNEEDTPQVVALLSLYIAICKEFEPKKIQRIHQLSIYLESIKGTKSEEETVDDMPRLV